MRLNLIRFFIEWPFLHIARIELDIVKCPEGVKGFLVLAQRCVLGQTSEMPAISAPARL
jgi:hypothetical protein